VKIPTHGFVKAIAGRGIHGLGALALLLRSKGEKKRV
jgi:hypothetical protein